MKQTILLTILAVVFGMTQFANSIFFSIGKWEKSITTRNFWRVVNLKKTNDTKFSLGDLLEIFYGRKTYAKYDKSALQWNKFVQDFCADPATERFPNKLQAAAKLWKIVRESTREKVYSHDLLNELNIL